MRHRSVHVARQVEASARNAKKVCRCQHAGFGAFVTTKHGLRHIGGTEKQALHFQGCPHSDLGRTAGAISDTTRHARTATYHRLVTEWEKEALDMKAAQARYLKRKQKA